MFIYLLQKKRGKEEQRNKNGMYNPIISIITLNVNGQETLILKVDAVKSGKKAGRKKEKGSKKTYLKTVIMREFSRCDERHKTSDSGNTTHITVKLQNTKIKDRAQRQPERNENYPQRQLDCRQEKNTNNRGQMTDDKGISLKYGEKINGDLEFYNKLIYIKQLG